MRWKVFYYQTERGDSPIEDFLNALPRKARAKCITYMGLLEEFGFNLPREYRFLYFAWVVQRFVILHAITKKTQKLKSKDIEIAEARMIDIRRRINHETASPIRQRTDQT